MKSTKTPSAQKYLYGPSPLVFQQAVLKTLTLLLNSHTPTNVPISHKLTYTASLTHPHSYNLLHAHSHMLTHPCSPKLPHSVPRSVPQSYRSPSSPLHPYFRSSRQQVCHFYSKLPFIFYLIESHLYALKNLNFGTWFKI